MEWTRLMCPDRIRPVNRNSSSTDKRTEFEKDYQRIISSASFRRLQDKTQVFPLDKSDFIRTRLTHSLVDASTEKVLGAEALLRWKSDEYGMVPPDTFIPFLENDPLFPELGAWIIKTAIKDTRKILELVPEFIVNVNLSYSQLERTDFTDSVLHMVKLGGIAPEHLCLEITERCRLLDMELLRNVIVKLRAGGVKVALDDFGTGYSSVGLVKNLPFDTIKIDRSFVREIELDEKEKRLLNNFTDMAGIFGADVCVEGIETSGMRDIIRDYGIHSFQGYYYSKPVPLDELLDQIKTGSGYYSKQ